MVNYTRHSKETIEAVENKLSTHPEKPDSMIAKSLGMKKGIVNYHRKRLGIPPSPVVRRDIIKKVMFEYSDMSDDGIVGYLGSSHGMHISQSTVYRVRTL